MCASGRTAADGLPARTSSLAINERTQERRSTRARYATESSCAAITCKSTRRGTWQASELHFGSWRSRSSSSFKFSRPCDLARHCGNPVYIIDDPITVLHISVFYLLILSYLCVCVCVCVCVRVILLPFHLRDGLVLHIAVLSPIMYVCV